MVNKILNVINIVTLMAIGIGIILAAIKNKKELTLSLIVVFYILLAALVILNFAT